MRAGIQYGRVQVRYPVIAISQVAPDASHAGQFLVLLALVVFPILLLLVEIL